MYGLFVANIERGHGGQPWVAALIGFDATYGFKREFVCGVRDYTHATRHTGRVTGVMMYFALPSGIYDTYDPGDKPYRKFIQVNTNGDIRAITKEAVIQCLKSNILPSMS